VSPSPLGAPTSDVQRGAAGPGSIPGPQGHFEPPPRPRAPEPVLPTTHVGAPPASERVDPGREPAPSDSAIAPVARFVNGGAHGDGGTARDGAPPVAGGAQLNGGARPVPFDLPRDPLHGIPVPAVGPDRNGQCTAPQLRRFIKSRPYVPMHELRRRFGIDGGDDDVTPVRIDPGWVYVGLPWREGSLLGDLLRAGEIGYELSLDPRTPIVIGVYPMRPIPRS
jgi:hypothetical protein